MMEESTPRTSSKWRPTVTFAQQMGSDGAVLNKVIIEHVERKGSVY